MLKVVVARYLCSYFGGIYRKPPVELVRTSIARDLLALSQEAKSQEIQLAQNGSLPLHSLELDVAG